MTIEKIVANKKVLFGIGNEFPLWVKTAESSVIKPLVPYTCSLVPNFDTPISKVLNYLTGLKYIHRDLGLEDYRLN